jgi:hypothetical protein
MDPNQDAIFERLEMTKQFGLLSDYLVSWTGRSGRLRPKVTVWGRDGMKIAEESALPSLADAIVHPQSAHRQCDFARLASMSVQAPYR